MAQGRQGAAVHGLRQDAHAGSQNKSARVFVSWRSLLAVQLVLMDLFGYCRSAFHVEDHSTLISARDKSLVTS